MRSTHTSFLQDTGRAVRTIVLLLVISLASFSASPADAGKGGKTAKTTTITSESTTTSLEATYVGSLEPTNIPIVTSDMYSLSAETGVDTLLQTDLAHTVATGKGVTVAVLDGGFTRPGAELMSRISDRMFDAVDRDGDPFDGGNGLDDDKDGVVDNALGHGTFVMGMICKVAPDAVLLPIRVSDDEGRVMEEWLYEGIGYARSVGVDVLNLSMEMRLLSDATVKRLYALAKEDGILLVVSSGNDASDGALGALADSELTIAVGAVDDRGTVAAFSNFDSDARWASSGTLLYALGVDLWGPCGYPYEDSTCIWSGTSFSAGLASGAAALGLEFYGMDPGTVYWMIQKHVDPVYTADGQQVSQAGQLNLLKFLEIDVEPIQIEPIQIEPIAEEPIAEEPIAEEPIAEEPIAEEPIAEEPIAIEPSTPKRRNLRKR